VVALVGGAGLLQVIDLVAYLFRMNAAKLGQMKKKNYKVFANEEFEELLDPSFKLELFISFPSISDVPYLHILSALEGWRTQYHFNNFQLHARYSDQTAEHWVEPYFKDNLPPSISKILLAGSKPFVTQVKTTLSHLGCPDQIITQL
jgi:hypothetical protein